MGDVLDPSIQTLTVRIQTKSSPQGTSWSILSPAGGCAGNRIRVPAMLGRHHPSVNGNIGSSRGLESLRVASNLPVANQRPQTLPPAARWNSVLASEDAGWRAQHSQALASGLLLGPRPRSKIRGRATSGGTSTVRRPAACRVWYRTGKSKSALRDGSKIETNCNAGSDRGVQISGGSKNGTRACRVKDNGIGIAVES
jgi:hypothetical protein